MQLFGFLVIAVCAFARVHADVIPGIGEYYYNGVPANWSTAYRQCQSSGGHLTVLNSVAEKNAIQEMMTRHGADTVLVGFHDQFVEGVYSFITGWSVPAPGSEGSLWASGYPIGGVVNSCGQLKSNGIIDASCAALQPFICELSEDQGGEVVSDEFTLVDGFGHYKFHDELVSWVDAWETCRKERSELIVVDSQAELDALKATFTAFAGFCWQGVHRLWGLDDGYVSIKNVPFSKLGYQTWFSIAEPTGTYKSHPFSGVFDVRGISSAQASNIARHFCKRPL